MISDKATSFNKADLRERNLLHGDIGPGCDRSVIVRWLRSNFQNPHEQLEHIGQNSFSPDSEVAGVYPKEQEMKNAPGLFGLMTLEIRLYVVITEASIADFLSPYFPEITITFDQSTLMTRLHYVTINLTSKPQTKINQQSQILTSRSGIQICVWKKPSRCSRILMICLD